MPDHEAPENSPEDDLSELVNRAYTELRLLAKKHLRSERPGHTLQPTALVHEAWIRLQKDAFVGRNRSHFFAAAAQAMRRILVEHARRRLAVKRGGGARRVAMEADFEVAKSPAEILDVDAQLTKFARVDPDKAALVKMRYFCGMSLEEIGEITGRSESSLKRDWAFARAWLEARLRKDYARSPDITGEEARTPGKST